MMNYIINKYDRLHSVLSVERRSLGSFSCLRSMWALRLTDMHWVFLVMGHTAARSEAFQKYRQRKSQVPSREVPIRVFYTRLIESFERQFKCVWSDRSMSDYENHQSKRIVCGMSELKMQKCIFYWELRWCQSMHRWYWMHWVSS